MTSRQSVTISRALEDRNLLGAGMGDLSTWATWILILKAAFGEPLDADELATFRAVAGAREPPPHRVRELWVVAGRRGGKTRAAAIVCSHIGAILDHSSRLSAGEIGYVLALSASRGQAKSIKDYAQGLLEASPVLKRRIVESTTEEIRLRGNITIATHTNSFRSVRGRTVIASVFDETAFWRDEASASPDVEVYRAVRPALGTTGGMLIGISSPYRKAGLLHERYLRYFGKDDPDVLVIQADTRALNPDYDRKTFDLAFQDDPEAARAEYGGEFRTDISSLFTETAIRGCVETGTVERPPRREHIYRAFFDAAGGSGQDSMTLAIAHTEGITRILDVVRERKPPFNPEAVIEEWVPLLQQYRIFSVTGDRYAGDWPAEQFRNRGISFEHTGRTKAELYLDLLPMVNSRAVDLLDDPRLISQLANLERTAQPSGRDKIDHPRGGHDDIANAVAGALTLTPASAVLPAWMRRDRPGHSYAVPEVDPFGAADDDPFEDAAWCRPMTPSGT